MRKSKKLLAGSLKGAKLSKTRGRREKFAKERQRSERRAKAARNDLLPDLQVIFVPIAKLSPPKNRTRIDSAEHIDLMAKSIAECGFSDPILLRGNQVIDGFTRVQAARQLGLSEVPAIRCDWLDDAKARALGLASNRIGERGKWDLDALKIELEELIELDVDPEDMGFCTEDQDIILLDCDEHDEGELETELATGISDQVVTRVGDVWHLNDHKIVCGDARDKCTYEALLGEERCDAVLTDPPYNVKIKGNVSGLGKKVHDEFTMASGEMTGDEFQTFLDTILGCLAAFLVTRAVLFVFMDWRSIQRVYAAGDAANLNLLNLAVWYKETGGMGALYRSAHELVAVMCKGKKPRVNNVELGKHGRDRTNVWVVPGANRKGSSANGMIKEHATPKPIELCEDALLDVTQRGDLVLDVFLGSGTTLIAADRVGRRCRGIELEPRFVDLSIRRWEKLTGHQPTLQETGQSFAEVAAMRAAAAPEDTAAGRVVA